MQFDLLCFFSGHCGLQSTSEAAIGNAHTVCFLGSDRKLFVFNLKSTHHLFVIIIVTIVKKRSVL